LNEFDRGDHDVAAAFGTSVGCLEFADVGEALIAGAAINLVEETPIVAAAPIP